MGIFPSGTEVAGSAEDQPFLSPEVRTTADRLSAEDGQGEEDDAEEEGSIRDAFFHGPDELDDLAVPVAFKEAVDYYIAYFTTRKRKMFASWLRRAKRYTPRLKEILRVHQLPEDLVYLAMIESGFNPRAYSRAKACGPWQFISATGTRYGLRINHWVDERRDFEKATVAAALYLKDLFDRFGCWYLAASGYNAGEGRVERAIKRHDTSDYWKIYRYNTLPRETRHYIPQLIAAAAISENPQEYGFSEITLDEVPEYGYCVRNVPAGTPLHLVAKASSTDLADIKSLNPELLTGITPPGKKEYSLKLPEDASLDSFDESLIVQLPGKRVVKTILVRSPKRQRSLTRILRRYGTTKSELALVNPNGLFRGRHIYVPLFDRKIAKAKSSTKPVLANHRSKKAPKAQVKTKGRKSRITNKRVSTKSPSVKLVSMKKASRYGVSNAKVSQTKKSLKKSKRPVSRKSKARPSSRRS